MIQGSSRTKADVIEEYDRISRILEMLPSGTDVMHLIAGMSRMARLRGRE